jgi:hypothetical protein
MNPRTEIGWTDPGNFPERVNSRPKQSRAASTRHTITHKRRQHPTVETLLATSAALMQTQLRLYERFRRASPRRVTTNLPA